MGSAQGSGLGSQAGDGEGGGVWGVVRCRSSLEGLVSMSGLGGLRRGREPRKGDLDVALQGFHTRTVSSWQELE